MCVGGISCHFQGGRDARKLLQTRRFCHVRVRHEKQKSRAQSEFWFCTELPQIVGR